MHWISSPRVTLIVEFDIALASCSVVGNGIDEQPARAVKDTRVTILIVISPVRKTRRVMANRPAANGCRGTARHRWNNSTITKLSRWFFAPEIGFLGNILRKLAIEKLVQFGALCCECPCGQCQRNPLMEKFMVGDKLLFDEDIKEIFEAFRRHMIHKSQKDLVTLTVYELIRIYDLPKDRLPRLWGRVASITGLPR